MPAKEYESRLGIKGDVADRVAARVAARVADRVADRLAELDAERAAKGDLLGESNGVESIFTGDAGGGLRSADIFGDLLGFRSADMMVDNLGTRGGAALAFASGGGSEWNMFSLLRLFFIDAIVIPYQDIFFLTMMSFFFEQLVLLILPSFSKARFERFLFLLPFLFSTLFRFFRF